EELGPIDDCTFVVNSQDSAAMRAVVLDSLALAGAREEQVLFLPPATYHFEEITILGTISRHSDYKSPRAIRYLERIAASVPSSGTERLYLSRNMYPRRQLVNETELLKVLEAFDYRVVHT